MADVFDIDDIGGEDVQDGAQSDEDDGQDSLESWVYMHFVSNGIYATQMISFY